MFKIWKSWTLHVSRFVQARRKNSNNSWAPQGCTTGSKVDKPERQWYAILLIAVSYSKYGRLYGGGGGSRTPVRKALRHGAYMLISVPFVSPAALRTSKKRSRLVRWFSPKPYGPKGSSQLTV